MLQIGNKPIDTMYVGGKLVQQAYMGSKKVYPLHGVIPKAIKDSMVLWYDIKRQGATNESMAANPVLADLSGNGHDATCYNFAWSGMSGVGGYNFTDFRELPGRSIYTKEGNKFHFTEKLEIVSNFLDIRGYTVGSDIKVKISGLTDNREVAFGNPIQERLDNGEYTITLPKGTTYTFGITGDVGVIDVTIEFLPLYSNALVSDGVDDYAQVTGLPLLTKERGYTVIAKRKWLEDLNSAIASKLNSSTGLNAAFIFEHIGSNYKKNIWTFGTQKVVDNFEESDISYQTSKSYNELSLNIGAYSIVDTDNLFLFKVRPTVSPQYGKFALYSFLLFDRDLTEQEIEWVKKNMIEGNDDDVDWYGVEFYTTSPNPDCVRIGNPELHKTLPVHSQMKGCLLADDGTVNKYLNESDWTSETMDGSQGQVMVEMPKESYWKFETDGNITRVKFSTKPLPGFKKTPQGYVSAYEASVQRSTNKLSSVVNTDADYRGGNNNAGWDGTYRSLLGMPATQISRTNFRNYARNRKADSTEWNCMTYDMQKLLYWLFVVEYGTLNSQKAFNADKDANGYAQGGFGNGVTNINGSKWSALNGYYPLIPCGYTNSLGNGTGQIAYTMPFEYEASGAANYAGEYSAEAVYTDGQFVSQGEELYECIADAAAGTALTDTTYFKKVTRTVTYVPRYRGVENPFGHLWQWTDGINVRISPTTDNGGDNLSKVFVCSDPAQFKDNGYEGYTYVGNEARTEQYVKEVIFGEGGEIMPKVAGDGASSTKYFCDYHYTNILATETLRGVLFGGLAYAGSSAGFVCAYSGNAPSRSATYFGSRLCFIPE